MKSLGQIKADNRMTSRDYGGMCNWFVFHEGDFLACFVREDDAKSFVSNYEYDKDCAGCTFQITKAA